MSTTSLNVSSKMKSSDPSLLFDSRQREGEFFKQGCGDKGTTSLSSCSGPCGTNVSLSLFQAEMLNDPEFAKNVAAELSSYMPPMPKAYLATSHRLQHVQRKPLLPRRRDLHESANVTDHFCSVMGSCVRHPSKSHRLLCLASARLSLMVLVAVIRSAFSSLLSAFMLQWLRPIIRCFYFLPFFNTSITGPHKNAVLHLLDVVRFSQYLPPFVVGLLSAKSNRCAHSNTEREPRVSDLTICPSSTL